MVRITARLQPPTTGEGKSFGYTDVPCGTFAYAGGSFGCNLHKEWQRCVRLACLSCVPSVNLRATYAHSDFSAALLSRQFVEMGRLRIEGLLAAFTKLVVGETGKQHTFVETDNVRYVYLPVETLYLLLITNKGSNIIEDLDTLRLLSQVIPEQLGLGIPVNEDSVANKAFELLFAFDEVIASGGYREDINLHTIVTNLQMESHEEKLAQMIKASKMAEAKEAAKRKAQELREKAKEEERTGVRSGNKYGTVSSDDYRMSRAFSSADPYNTSSSSSRSNARDDGPTSSSADSGSGAAATSKAASKSGTGMKLGAKKAAGGMSGAMAGVIAEEGLRAKDLMVDDMGSSGAGSSAQAAINAAKAAAEAASADQVVVTIEEKVTVGITRDGACEQMEVKGSLSLQVQDESASKVQVVLTRGDDRQFQYSNNPNINKARFAAEAVLALKQADKPFPVGQPLGVLRWSYRNKDDDGGQVPLMITCWPEESGRGEMTVSVEYTLQRTEITLREVLISIPL